MLKMPITITVLDLPDYLLHCKTRKSCGFLTFESTAISRFGICELQVNHIKY